MKIFEFIFALIYWSVFFVIGVALVVLTWPIALMLFAGIIVHLAVKEIYKGQP